MIGVGGGRRCCGARAIRALRELVRSQAEIALGACGLLSDSGVLSVLGLGWFDFPQSQPPRLPSPPWSPSRRCPLSLLSRVVIWRLQACLCGLGFTKEEETARVNSASRPLPRVANIALAPEADFSDPGARTGLGQRTRSVIASARPTNSPEFGLQCRIVTSVR